MATTRLQVMCINKTDRYNAHERIKAIGGTIGTSYRWHHTQEQAIKWIEDGSFAYYVINKEAKEIDVIVATSPYGHKYIKTKADGEHPDNLLSLPECPN